MSGYTVIVQVKEQKAMLVEGEVYRHDLSEVVEEETLYNWFTTKEEAKAFMDWSMNLAETIYRARMQ
jgi:hypothetical protein